MVDSIYLQHEAERTLDRLQPHLRAVLKDRIAGDPAGWKVFQRRLAQNFPRLFSLYFELYGNRYDFFFHIEDLIVSLARCWFARPEDLRALDKAREKNPHWFQSNQMLGGVCYVDLFAGSLKGIKAKIPYFKELGLTYLHLMPLFKAPAHENDGGYAVSSYREVNPEIGTMKQLSMLASDLRAVGISLALDFVFNHTSDEHTWAKRAKAGDKDYQDFYHIFPDRKMPDAYEHHLREIFPDEHPGAFSPVTINDRTHWVWTTFHRYQWDLNYDNPVVFNCMAGELLFLANQGVEVLRLDAVAFIWKQLGTSCENLAGAHTLIRAFNTAARIAAPALFFKSEAIVHPDEVVKYIHSDECQLSYNPLIMALLWNSLATRKVRLLTQALSHRFQIDSRCAWVNYVRSHDDIGWTFSDEDAALLGVRGDDHRHFLNEFYRGRFPGSFARGLPFQENPKTGDCRISGTCASLAGLEKALKQEGAAEVDLAIRRILLIYSVVMTIGGIPLIYLGDEVGTLNDYSYLDDPNHARDSRWVHRPRADWRRIANRKKVSTVEGRVYQGLQRLVALRKRNSIFSDSELQIISTKNDHVLGYTRMRGTQRALVFANFSEDEQMIPMQVMDANNIHSVQSVFGASQFVTNQVLTLAPLDFLVLF